MKPVRPAGAAPMIAAFAVAHAEELLGRSVLDFELRGYAIPDLAASLREAECQRLIAGKRNTVNSTVFWSATPDGRNRVERVLADLAESLTPHPSEIEGER